MTDGLQRRRVLRLAASVLAGAPAAVLAGGCAVDAEPSLRTEPRSAAVQPSSTPQPLSTRTADTPQRSFGPQPSLDHAVGPAQSAESPPGGSSADRALAALVEGNRRFVRGAPLHPHSLAEARVHALLQRPLAAVIGCCDARVAPEALLDQGLGDLFVVRTVAQALDTAAIASLEYAVADLAVPLILVLGHERCGAIRAAIDSYEDRERRLPLSAEPVPPHLRTLLGGLDPVVRAALRSGASDPYEKAMRLNIERVAQQLAGMLAGLLAATGARIASARYDLDDGRLRILS